VSFRRLRLSFFSAVPRGVGSFFRFPNLVSDPDGSGEIFTGVAISGEGIGLIAGRRLHHAELIVMGEGPVFFTGDPEPEADGNCGDGEASRLNPQSPFGARVGAFAESE
jgi:hypothetical protein